MIDVHSRPTALTVQLAADLVAELATIAEYKQWSVDELVQEACLEYIEPLIWEKIYKESEDKAAKPAARPKDDGSSNPEMREKSA